MRSTDEKVGQKIRNYRNMRSGDEKSLLEKQDQGGIEAESVRIEVEQEDKSEILQRSEMQPRGELDRTDRKLIENFGDSPEDKGKHSLSKPLH